jgi:hypothetical protein
MAGPWLLGHASSGLRRHPRAAWPSFVGRGARKGSLCVVTVEGVPWPYVIGSAVYQGAQGPSNQAPYDIHVSTHDQKAQILRYCVDHLVGYGPRPSQYSEPTRDERHIQLSRPGAGTPEPPSSEILILCTSSTPSSVGLPTRSYVHTATTANSPGTLTESDST